LGSAVLTKTSFCEVSAGPLKFVLCAYVMNEIPIREVAPRLVELRGVVRGVCELPV
jgi:hypothetical protein